MKFVVVSLFALLLAAGACHEPGAAPSTGQATSELTFPSNWNPVLQATGAMGDVTTDAQQDSRNIVGNTSFPAVFIANNGNEFFVRLRLQDNPVGMNGDLKQFAWGLLFNTDGNFDKYEYSLLLDASGNPDQIVYGANQVFGQLGDPSDTAEIVLAAIPLDMVAPDHNVVVTQADTCFDAGLVPTCTGPTDPDRDYFLDFGVPMSIFALPAMPPPAPMDITQPVQILAGSSSSGQNLSLDLGGCDVNGPNSISQCQSLPTSLTCGNGVVEGAEGCDDGNSLAGDGCNAVCKIEDGRACRASAPGSTGSASCASALCDTTSGAPGVCEPPNTCGNGVREAGEGCDDGGTAAGDGCSATCLVENGSACNGAAPGLTGGASCASALCDTTGGGTGVCEPVDTCGNGVREAGEGCDDGGTAAGDGCNAVCLVEDANPCNVATPGATGNGSCASGVCDSTGGAPGVCEPVNTCGNGVREAGEGCDDGGTTAGDGCNAACLIENGDACNGTAPGALGSLSCASGLCDTTGGGTGVCEPINTCGNGVREAGEGCDDGGTTAGDGCSSTCLVENNNACNAVVPGATGNASCQSGLCDLSGGAPGVCRPSNSCGNGVREAGEGCDDGGTSNGDGCNSVCLIEDSRPCNAATPGNTGNDSCASSVCDSTGGAPGVCEPANSCGNGMREAGEGCDDGGTAAGDGCSASCLVENGEACNASSPGATGSGSCQSGLCDTTGGGAGVCEAINTCGNGVREAGEGCDDGGTAPGDGCNAACLVEDGLPCNGSAPGALDDASCASNICDTSGGGAGVCEPANTCGNGVREAGEGCDDGGTAAGDGCNAVCLVENGTACNGAAPGLVDDASCASNICDTSGGGAGVCEPANTCGNGVREAGEGCDDGGTAAGDGCNAVCLVENGTACNATAPGLVDDASCASNICDTTGGGAGVCEPANACGNGVREAGEGCDDGGTAVGDGCSASCLVETGTACNQVSPGLTDDASCQSGLCDSTAGLPGVCEAANVCGNGVREAGEGCDDGGTATGDGCNAACLVEDGDACNAATPGNTGNDSCASGVCDASGGAPGVCEPAATCGNGAREAGEGCDDGNTTAGDGCNAACLIEDGRPCNIAVPGNTGDASCASDACDTRDGSPGVCGLPAGCGNGVLDADEGCDDGNTTSGDGCDASCLVEEGAVCNVDDDGRVGASSCATGYCDPSGSCALGVGIAGGGCHASSGGEGTAAAALLLLLSVGLVSRRRRGAAVVAGLALAAVAMLGSRPAAAQVSTNYSAERFELSGFRDGILGVDWADVRGHLTFDAALWIGYANDPITVYSMTTGERVGALVHNRVGGDIVAAGRFRDRYELGVAASLIVAQSEDRGMTTVGDEIASAGLGDLRLSGKATILRRGATAVAVMVVVGLPTSTVGDYGGDTSATLSPGLAASHRAGKVRLAANLGYRARSSEQALDLVVDDEAYLRLGAGYVLPAGVELDATFDLATAANDVLGAFNRNHAELRGGAAYDIGSNLRLFGAVGAGVAEGFGTPDWRALVGVRMGFARKAKPVAEPLPVSLPPPPPVVEPPIDPDPDHDGVLSPADQCPDQPEDVDAFEDDNGCPDPDNDQDTVLDTDDTCRDVAGVPLLQGCPEPDRDSDKIVDRLDNCPDEPGLPEFQGCQEKQLVVITDDKLEILDTVYFKTDKAIIEKKSYGLLDNVASVLTSHPTIRVEVEGHTDDAGNDAYNKKLSQRRAEAVVAYLVKKGVDAGRLQAMGFGEEKPVGDNKTKEGRATNRRVVFTILGTADGVKVESTGPTEETIDR